MAAIRWSHDLSVGIQEIDLQHRQLVELMSSLDKALALGQDKELMGRVMRELNTYAREHFTTEERWMERCEFPGLTEHAAQHGIFVEKLLHFELDYLGGQAGLSREVLVYLLDWLKKHIAGYDQLYAKYFREKGLV